ncbi:MAG: OmpA family protein, partial [Deltaproteobacteria bacterium]|nr:OmpA family protein [Deltaproteobacteria bacterium]
FTNGLQSISDLSIGSGSNLQGLNLPIDPQGVVYDSLVRTPISGATLSLVDAGGSPVAATCFDDPNQQGQVTGSNGYYKFHLNFSDATCQPGDPYKIEVVPPGTGFTAGTSEIIPPPTAENAITPFDVPSCPNDAVPGQYCEILDSEFAPPATAATDYHLYVRLDDTLGAASSQAFNNHIPIDPVFGGSVAITKTTPKINVSRGDLVPYEITFRNQLGVPLADLVLRDSYPGGFRYIKGSARVDGVPSEPTRDGRVLYWDLPVVNPSSSHTVVLLLGVGAGVTEGEFVNRASVIRPDPDPLIPPTTFSGEATATVRVVPDPTFDCTDVIGKVFDDKNRDGVQDEGEDGLPGVRLVTVRGLAVNTDPHGRFHITCAIVPNEERGSNFVLKLDDRTLPSGYRMSTRQTQVKRATRGKALRFQFGASINRVVGLDLADAVFEPGSVEMREQWKSRLTILLDELEKSESILRLSYVADIEDPQLVERRLETVKQQILEAWKARGGKPLSVETEIYWRRGSPVKAPPRERETSSLQSLLPPVGAGPPGFDASSGQSKERHFPIEPEPTQWTVDPELLESQLSDRLEEREVLAEKIDTIKLKDVVPPIRFESGVADISPSYVTKLRTVLDDMQDLDNVRLHLVGHADDQALSGALSSRFGDNEGLSRERAGDVAEHLQAALSLPPESISYAWAGDAQPVASNATPEGRALNRRVEVEVWYDEIGEEAVVKEVVIPQEIKRFKVCRTETVCKLRYREGNERRARVKNLIPPLDYDAEVLDIPEKFVRQIEEALVNLRDKQNVTVKFIAHTDDVPLTGRAARIYGTHLSISKARAHRIALEIKDALDLPTAGIASEGRGASRPVASNATPRGRALNRRIEVEFWHDDPLLELSDELQVCPDPADAETVTRLYHPPWGRFEALQIE